MANKFDKILGEYREDDSGGGGGSGDMTKAVYDTDDDGVVDNAELLGGLSTTYLVSRSNHTDTQLASTISDFDDEVDNNATVQVLVDAIHSSVSVTDTDEIDLTLTGQDIQADIQSQSISAIKLSQAVQTTLAQVDVLTEALHSSVTVTDTDEIDLTLNDQDLQADIQLQSISAIKLSQAVQTTLAQVDVLTEAIHSAVTVTDTDEIDLTLTAQDLQADIQPQSISAVKLSSAVQTTLAYVDQDVTSSGTPTFTDLTLTGNLNTQSLTDTGQLSVQPSGATSPYAFVIDEPTTNLIENPKFENNITDFWSDYGTVTRTRDTSIKWVGSASLKMVTSTADSGTVSDAMAVSANTDYVLSFRIRGASGGENYKVQIVGDNSGVTTYPSGVNSGATLTDTFQQARVTKTTNGSDTTLTVRIVSADTTSQTIYIDGVQLEAKSKHSTVTQEWNSSYCDGDMGDGYSWSGTANNSSSTRAAGAHFPTTVAADSAGNFVVRADGTVERIYGRADTVSRGSWNADEPWFPYTYTGEMVTSLLATGQSQGIFLVENTANGIAMYVKSEVTTDTGFVLDCASLTSGVGMSVYAPANLSTMVSNNGYFFTFADKDENNSHTWAPHFSASGTFGLPWYQRQTFIGQGGSTTTDRTGLSGTVTATNGSASVTGASTAFLTDYQPGDIIQIQRSGATYDSFQVASIASNTALTLASNYNQTTGGSKLHKGKTRRFGSAVVQFAGGWSDHNNGFGDNVYSLYPSSSDGQFRFYQSSAREDLSIPSDEFDGDPLVSRRFSDTTTRTDNDATETDVVTGYTVPAYSFINDGEIIRIKFFGQITATASTQTMVWRVNLGGTAILTTPAIQVGATAVDFSGEVTIVATGNSSQKVFISINGKDNTATGAGITYHVSDYSTGSVDMRLDRALTISTDWTNASQTIDVEHSSIERL